MTDTTDAIDININITKKAKIEFAVHIQGVGDDGDMVVRMVLKDTDLGGDLSFTCEPLDEESQWCVEFPPLAEVLKRNSYPFVLEVLVDGYYFAPAEGSITCISAPSVDLTAKKKKKPSVKASFVVKQEDTEPVTEQVSQGAGTATDSTSPTTALLSPELPPDDVEPLTQAEKDKYDPSEVAEQIIRKQMKKVQAPTEKGFLFSRTGDGKAHVEGLETKEAKQLMTEKAAKVKQILSGD
jgi:hypothetical protein